MNSLPCQEAVPIRQKKENHTQSGRHDRPISIAMPELAKGALYTPARRACPTITASGQHKGGVDDEAATSALTISPLRQKTL